MDINEVREDRIIMEVVVDAYDEMERAMGWYYYLEDRLNFPFAAKWLTGNGDSEVVKVVGMPIEDDCLEDMLVEVAYQEDGVEDVFTLSLREIQPLTEDAATQEAIADWHYWLARGYEF